VLKAITAYVQSLNSPPTPYDRYLAGETDALSEEARAGLALFEGKAGCSRCHSGPLLSDGRFYNIGVATDPAMFDDPERHLTFRRFFRILGVPNYRSLREDVGLYALTMNPDDWGKFRTPSLREVARTAPYMHDGSLATLEDVVRFYNQGGGPGQTAGLEPLGLTETEIAQLVAFLESLSSEPIPVEVPTLPDYELLPLGAVAEAAAQEQPAMTQPTAPGAEAAEAAAPSAEVVAAFNKGLCGSCHVIPGIPGARGQVGPDLSNIGAEAAQRRPGYTALEYLKESILDPEAFLAPQCPAGACPPGVMPSNFGETLSPEELELILNYLSALGTGRK
jgi:cytochrome c peroxidase